MSFCIFYYTSRSINNCCQAFDEPSRFQLATPRSDIEERELICRQCQCCIWPILIPIDIITFPFRGIYYFIKKYTKKNNKNNNN